MTAVTNDPSFILISAGALLAHYAYVLSDFEVETIAEVSRRWLKTPDVAITTDTEFAVIEAAVAAMRAEARRPIEKAAA
jgi:uncharacterized membrane protein